MNEKLREFLKEGMKRYEEAYHTLQFFEKSVESIIRDILEKKNNWGTFVLKKSNDAIETSSGYGSGAGRWIDGIVTGSITIRGKKHDAIINCGIWWGAEYKGKSGTIIYTSFYEQPKDLLNFEYREKDPQVHSFSRWKRTYLYKEPKPDYNLVVNLPQDLNLILDVLQKQFPLRE